VDVGDIADVSEVHADTTYRIEVYRLIISVYVTICFKMNGRRGIAWAFVPATLSSLPSFLFKTECYIYVYFYSRLSLLPRSV
jgi:hypothetical protein